MPRTPVSVITAGVALALALTACTAPPVPKPTSTPAAVAIIAPSGDGVLRIGTLFPMTGAAAASGAAQVAGTELAARVISEQRGGTAVELVHRDSAGDPAAALADLLARGVDVVLWDATSEAPPVTSASVTASSAVLLRLNAFANGGTPLTADAAFAARLLSADPGLSDTAGGAEAYDGVILSALAATAAGDDGGASVAAGWNTVAAGPTVCVSWGECLVALGEMQHIGYQGATGLLSADFAS